MSNPDPMMLAKKGNSMNPSQHEQQIDPALIQALARVIAERGMRAPGYSPGFQEGLNQGAAEDAYAQDAAQSRAQYGMMQDGSPNALQGGRTSGFADAVAEGDPNSELYRMFVGAPQPAPLPGVGSGADLALANAGFEQAPAGMAYEDGSVQQEPAVKQDMGAKPKKKKGEYSDFFKLLKAAKSGDKTTKKSITDLAKQLEASGGEVPVT